MPMIVLGLRPLWRVTDARPRAAPLEWASAAGGRTRSPQEFLPVTADGQAAVADEPPSK